MSTHAIGTSEGVRPDGARSGAVRALPYLDLAVVALALPLFLVADLPLLGWGACSGVWVAQRAVQSLVLRRAAGSRSPRTVAGLLGVSMVARVWVVAVAILLAGLAEREAGLPAAVYAVVLFQVWFTAMMISRTLERKGAP